MSFGKSDSEKSGTTCPAANGSFAGGQPEAFLGTGSKVIGNLSFSGPVHLGGEVEGEIHCKDRLTIGQSANVKAKISGTDVLVQGVVTGDISAAKSISLKKPAKVLGNISCESLSIEEGVVFEGSCSMKPGTVSASGSASVAKV